MTRLRRTLVRSLWTVVHDIVAHPVCGVLWVAQAKRWGDRLHDATLPPLSWEDETFLNEQGMP